MFCCLDTGQLRFMMKLEVNPSCIYPYGVVPTSECKDYSTWLKQEVDKDFSRKKFRRGVRTFEN